MSNVSGVHQYFSLFKSACIGGKLTLKKIKNISKIRRTPAVALNELPFPLKCAFFLEHS